MFKVLKIGHIEFEVKDLSRMTEFYSEVMGLTVTDRDSRTAYLSTAVDHHSMILRQGGGRTQMTKLAFQVAPAEPAELVAHLEGKGAAAEILTNSQPGIDKVVRTRNADGLGIELYSAFEPSDHPYTFRGVNPVKLSHVAALAPDPRKSMTFYVDVLGFRFSDSARDFFFFLRCGADHHTVNLLAGDYVGLQHFAFELSDMDHMRAACDEFRRRKVDVLWGPVRHGIGHNIATYVRDPEGQIVEVCAELDRMSNEELGYFDPRPYHEDRPQRPKRWEDTKAAGALWGQFPPPPAFGVGVSAVAIGIAH